MCRKVVIWITWKPGFSWGWKHMPTSNCNVHDILWAMQANWVNYIFANTLITRIRLNLQESLLISTFKALNAIQLLSTDFAAYLVWINYIGINRDSTPYRTDLWSIAHHTGQICDGEELHGVCLLETVQCGQNLENCVRNWTLSRNPQFIAMHDSCRGPSCVDHRFGPVWSNMGQPACISYVLFYGM